MLRRADIRKNLPASIMVLLLLGGCVTAMPASEGLVFSRVKTGPTSDSTLQAGTLSIAYDRDLNAAPVERYANAASSGDIGWFPYAALKLGWMATPSEDVWIEGYFGFMALGADATVRLPQNVYATLNGGLGGVEAILQTPILRRTWAGISLGGYYRLSAYGTYHPCDDFCFPGPIKPDEWLRVHDVGGRALFQIAQQGKLNEHALRFFVGLGFAPQLRSTTFRFGVLATGFY